MRKLYAIIEFLPLLLMFATWVTMVVLFFTEFKIPLLQGGSL